MPADASDPVNECEDEGLMPLAECLVASLQFEASSVSTKVLPIEDKSEGGGSQKCYITEPTRFKKHMRAHVAFSTTKTLCKK